MTTTTDEAARPGATCVGCGNPVPTAGACDSGCPEEPDAQDPPADA